MQIARAGAPWRTERSDSPPGLQYVPGTYARARPRSSSSHAWPATSGGLYASHMRNEGTALEAGRRGNDSRRRDGAGARSRSRTSRSTARAAGARSAKALAMIDAATKRGAGDVDGRLSIAYTAASSNLGIRFPSWVLEGGQPKINERLDDSATVAAHQGGDEDGLIRERGLEN